jgi:hypothetical protein
MQLKNLELPGTVIASLYRQSLVITGENDYTHPSIAEPGTTGIDDPQPVKSKLHYLGENKKNVLILVGYEQMPFLPDEELSFLTGMLSACRLSLADVAIVNVKNNPVHTYKELKSEVDSSIILLFDTAPESISMPLSFPHFQVQSFNNTTFLSVPSLFDIQNDKILKSKLWVCLRRIFNV